METPVEMERAWNDIDIITACLVFSMSSITPQAQASTMIGVDQQSG
jgi:hypothetical protein